MLTKEKLLEVMTTATAKFNDALKARQDANYEKFVDDDTCGSAGYSPYMLGGVGAGRKWIGSRVYTRLRSYGVRFNPEKWEKTIEADATELADNPAYASGNKLAEKLAESWFLTDAKAVQAVLKDNAIGFGGEALFGTHEYVDQNADGTVKLDGDGNPIVTASFSNDMGGSGQSWYLLNEKAVTRVTREGEEPKVVLKGGTPETSEHTFDNDTIVVGWRTRKIYAPGMAYNALRSKQAVTPENLQAAEDRFTTFVNDAGEYVSAAPKFIAVKKGTAAANAFKAILDRQLINGGESNQYYKRFELLELDYL